MRRLLFVVALLLAVAVAAPPASAEEKTVVVVGYGMDSGQALDNAFANAVLEALSESVDARVLAMNHAALAESILANPARFVLSHELADSGVPDETTTQRLPVRVVLDAGLLADEAEKVLTVEDGPIPAFVPPDLDELAAQAAAAVEGYPWNIIKLDLAGSTYDVAQKELLVNVNVDLDGDANDAVLRRLEEIFDKAAVEPPMRVRRHLYRVSKEDVDLLYGAAPEVVFNRRELPDDRYDNFTIGHEPLYGEMRLYFANKRLTEGMFKFYRIPYAVTDAMNAVLGVARWQLRVEAFAADGSRVGLRTVDMETTLQFFGFEKKGTGSEKREYGYGYHLFPFMGSYLRDDMGTHFYVGRTDYVKTISISMDAATAAKVDKTTFTLEKVERQ